MDLSVNAIDPDIVSRLLEILDKPYKLAKIGIFNLMSESKEYSPSLMLQFTSVLDHIEKSLIESAGDRKKQIMHLNIAEDYLRRVSIESREVRATEKYSSILECLKKPRIYYQLALLSLPSKNRIDTHIRIIEYHLQRGTQLKEGKTDWELCLKEYDEAYEEAVNLKNQLPDNDEVRFRLAEIIIPIAISVVIAILFRLV